MSKSWFRRQIEAQSDDAPAIQRGPASPSTDDDPSAPVDHKTLQLCKEVERTLGLAFADGDGLVRELMVLAVVPEPDSLHLKVIVGAGDPSAELEESAVLEALHRCSGHLRTAVTESVNRRKTPELAFSFQGPRRQAS